MMRERGYTLAQAVGSLTGKSKQVNRGGMPRLTVFGLGLDLSFGGSSSSLLESAGICGLVISLATKPYGNSSSGFSPNSRNRT